PFEPEKFEDRYEEALVELIDRKRNGKLTGAKPAPKTSGNVINLMDALKKSLSGTGERKVAATPAAKAAPAAKAKGKKKRAEGQARDAAADLRQRQRKACRQGRAEEGREAGTRAGQGKESRLITRVGRRHSRGPSPLNGLLDRRVHQGELVVEPDAYAVDG